MPRAVRREGSITQRSKGSWQLRYYGPPDAQGKQKQLNETVRGLRKDAERVLRERLTAIENGGHIAKDRETVAQFFTRWLETYAATNTTLRTQQGYRQYINGYIVPSIGSVVLQKVTPQQIQGIYSHMIEKGLSNTTVSQLHRILHKAFGTAVKWGLLIRNPVEATTPPRLERKQLEMWDLDTIHRFLEAARESRFSDLYHLAVLTGMRRSELCGLTWENVDLAAGRLSVVQTLQRLSGHGLVEGLPKTARSRRSISLSPQAVDAFQAIRNAQLAQQLEAGPLWENTGYVFTQVTGAPVDPDMVSKDFPQVVRNAGLPHLTLHGLRHAHATLLLTAGVHPKVVSERLGHSTVSVTLDIYSHVLPGLQEEAVLLLDKRLSLSK